MKHCYITLSLLLFSFQIAFAQTFPLGLNPPSVKWKQINTDKVQVVFQDGQEAKAQRVTNLVHYLHGNHLETLGEKNGKVTIFLHNQTTISNGFVALAPFRSEFYLTPPQNNFLGTADWLDLLTIHEYRHVNQNFNANRGISKVVTTIFGENGLAFMRAMSIPRWFTEGDAVVEETILSSGGRGRNPAFDMEYRAVFEQKKFFNYEKASAGSLKDFVPSHYTLGYYMVGNARKMFGKDIWSSVYEDATHYKGIFYPLSRNLKKHTGLKPKELYKITMEGLDSMWSQPIAQPELTIPFDVQTKNSKQFTSYRVAQPLSNGEWLVEKSGFNHIRRVLKLDKMGNEKELFKPGINSRHNVSLSVAQNKVVWAEQAFDMRWGNKDYSIIKSYDLYTKRKTTLTKESKYFTPALSPDASKIVVSSVEASGENALVILDAYSGSVLHKVANPENLFFSQPKWLEDGKTIVAISQKGNKQGMVLVNTQTDAIRELLPYGDIQMTYPYPKGEFVYFSGAHSGINNIYAVKLATSGLYQLTSSKIGAYEPSVSEDGKTLVYSEFTPKGYKLKSLKVQPAMWPVVEADISQPKINYYDELTQQIGGNAMGNVPNEVHPVSKYRQTSGLVNLHSFQPIPFHPNYTGRLQFDNKFSTLSAQLGFNYNANEESTRYFFDLSYGQFFPVLRAGMNFGGERSRAHPFLNSEQVTQDSSRIVLNLYNRQWKENDYYAGFTLPFNLTHGNYFTNLSFTALGHLIDIDYEPSGFGFDGTEMRRSGSFGAMDLELNFSNIQTRARRQFNPRWGQSLDISYKQTIGTQNNKGAAFSANGSLFFPGLLLDHSLFFSGAYRQERFTDNYKFRDDFFYSRGYDSSLPYDHIYRLSANYGFPLIYPDLALGSFAFIKRVRANLFYDYSSATLDPIDVTEIPNATNQNVRGQTSVSTVQNSSMGVELIFDFRALRLIDLGAGVRFNYLLDDFSGDNTQFDIILLTVGL